MSPDVDFTLTEEDFKSLGQRLPEQGIAVRPKSRETFEDLEKGCISHVCTSGILVFCNCEFIYHVWQDTRGYRLTIDAFAHRHGVGVALVAAIKRAYPQPEHSFPDRPAPAGKLDKSRVVNSMGCIGVLLFLCVICFFAVWGIWSFFR